MSYQLPLTVLCALLPVPALQGADMPAKPSEPTAERVRLVRQMYEKLPCEILGLAEPVKLAGVGYSFSDTWEARVRDDVLKDDKGKKLPILMCSWGDQGPKSANSLYLDRERLPRGPEEAAAALSGWQFWDRERLPRRNAEEAAVYAGCCSACRRRIRRRREWRNSSRFSISASPLQCPVRRASEGRRTNRRSRPEPHVGFSRFIGPSVALAAELGRSCATRRRRPPDRYFVARTGLSLSPCRLGRRAGANSRPVKRSPHMEPLSVGAVIEASVTRLEPYGAWVECAGRPGLITIPEVSWSRISHPGDVLHVGQRVRAKVLVLGPAGELALSIRAAHPEQDPWRDPLTFAPGKEFVGPVALVLGYGCFVQLAPEVRGLLRRGHWSRDLAVGDRVCVRVVSADPITHKVELIEGAEDRASG